MCLIALFGRETSVIRLYDRTDSHASSSLFDRHSHAARHAIQSDSIIARINALIGLTGVKLSQFRTPWRELCIRPYQLCWRPHLLSIMIYEVASFFILAWIGLTVQTGSPFRIFHRYESYKLPLSRRAASIRLRIQPRRYCNHLSHSDREYRYRLLRYK